MTVTETAFNGSDLVLTVNATENSVYVNSFTVSYEDNGGSTPVEPDVYKKVTSTVDLVAGKKYVILYENGSSSVGMGELNTSRYGTPVTGLSIEDNKVDIAGTGVMTMTLGGENNAWTLYMDNAGRYLANQGLNPFTSSETAPSSATDITKWTITPSASATTIRNNNTESGSNKNIRYYSGSSSPVFQCNTATFQSPVALYVKYAGQVDEISFSPVAGTYQGTQNVTISCGATSDATIYYTTDGNTPTTSSTVYTGPIEVTQDMTIKVLAVAPAMDSRSAEAAYSITAAPQTTTYEKITSTDDLTDGNYLIVYEGGNLVFDGSRTTLDAVSNTKSVTINNHQIETAEEIFFTYDANAKTLKSASGYYIGRTADSNGIDVNQSTAYINTISFDNDGNANIVGSGGAYLRYNKDSGSTRFRYYKSSTYNAQQAIQLYKRKSTEPELSVSNNELSIDVPYNESSANAMFTVTGANLSDNVTVNFSGASGFSIDPSSTTLAIDANGNVSQQYTVTYSGTSTENVVATITFTCGDLTQLVTVTAKKELPPPPTMSVSTNSLAVGANGNSFNVTAANLTQALAVTPSTGFSATPTTIAADATYPAAVNVAYSGKALSATGTVTVGNTADNLSQTVNVTYTYDGDMYIVGDLNHSGWDFANGVQMTRNQDGTYSAHVTAQAGGEGYAWLYFTKQVGNEQTVVANAFGPVSDGNWGLTSNLYGVPCKLDVNGNLNTIYMNPGSYEIVVNPANNTFTITPSVAAPVITPATGTYREAQTVEITCATPGAAIYYTTDGTTPTTSSTLYNGSFTVDATTTITAIAVSNDLTSDPVTSTITIKLPGSDEFILVESTDDITADDEYVLVYTSTDGVNHAMSTHNGSYYIDAEDDGFILDGDVVTVEDDEKVNIFTLIDADEGTFYIKDMDEKYIQTAGKGNVSRSNDPISKWSITLDNNGAASIYSGGWYLQFNASSPRFACYAGTVQNAKLYKRGSTVKVQAPVITPAGGTSNKFYESVDVEITCATENVTIYYTLDGSTPTASSDEYDPAEGLTVPYGSAPTTVKAIAVDGEGNVSKVTTVVYYWDRVKVAITPASQQVTSNVDVTITPTPSDATVTYKVNGGATQTYTGSFTVTVNEENPEVTVVATATKGESTATATATYTLKDGGVNSIAEFNALNTGEEVFFKNPVTVLFDYSQNTDATQDYIWVKDRTGYAQLFITPAFDNTNFKPKYENGDVIPAGFTVVKNYYSNGGYFQGFCDGDNRSTFKDAKEKALADPEQVTLTQLLNSIPNESGKYSEYNNRYLYINKLKVSNINGLNFRIATDEDGDGTAEVSGGSDVVGYNKYHDWKDKGGNLVGVTLPTDGQYYNVTFIFQKWQNGYEIMPIKFTKWEEKSVRLEDLVDTGVKNDTYTISNDLVAVKVTWDDSHKMFAIFAKDDEMYAESKKRSAEGLSEYVINYKNGTINNTVAQDKYDQSNWIEILIPNENNVTLKSSAQYLSTLIELQEKYENKILPGGTIKGAYVDDFNPTIQLSEALSNQLELKDSQYDPNIFCTGNFLMENLDNAGAISYHVANDGKYFMMDAKPQEFCMVVWAYYEGGNSNNYFVAPMPEGAEINGYGFHGSFLANMSLCEDVRGLDNIEVDANTNVASCFLPSNDSSFGNQQKLYGFNAVVRKNSAYWNAQGGNGAPSRIQPYTDADGNDKEAVPAYIVYPLNVGSKSNGNVTDVEEVNGVKLVESVRYYNIMGVESEQPFEGINIIVTRYNDGSISTTKVLR